MCLLERKIDTITQSMHSNLYTIWLQGLRHLVIFCARLVSLLPTPKHIISLDTLERFIGHFIFLWQQTKCFPLPSITYCTKYHLLFICRCWSIYTRTRELCIISPVFGGLELWRMLIIIDCICWAAWRSSRALYQVRCEIFLIQNKH